MPANVESMFSVTTPMTLTGIMQTAADLLTQADDSGLAGPMSASLNGGGAKVRLNFPGRADSYHALTGWATRFGGELTGEPYTFAGGEQTLHCQVYFLFQGVTVEAYAFIPANQLDST
jgi:hypothetical protein